MTDKQTAIHNELVRVFMGKVVREIYVADGTFADVMVLLESITALSSCLGQKHDLPPRTAATMVEEMIHQAVERFSKVNNQ